MTRRKLVPTLCLVPLLIAPAAAAQGLDGSTPLVCDLVNVSECDGTAVCTEVNAADVDVPPVVQVDFAAHQLRSPDGQRTSAVAAQETLDAVLVLHGHENGRGWTMVIDRASGHLSATIADTSNVFVIAGACTAP